MTYPEKLSGHPVSSLAYSSRVSDLVTGDDVGELGSSYASHPIDPYEHAICMTSNEVSGGQNLDLCMKECVCERERGKHKS